MKYRRLVAAGLTAAALTITVAGCGGSSSESPSTTSPHDMSKMQPGDTMHDMSKMQPGETMAPGSGY